MIATQRLINVGAWLNCFQVTCCASVPDCRLLFVAGTSGTITIYNTVFNQAKVLILKKSNKESASKITEFQIDMENSALQSEHQLTSSLTGDCFYKEQKSIFDALLPRVSVLYNYVKISSDLTTFTVDKLTCSIESCFSRVESVLISVMVFWGIFFLQWESWKY